MEKGSELLGGMLNLSWVVPVAAMVLVGSIVGMVRGAWRCACPVQHTTSEISEIRVPFSSTAVRPSNLATPAEPWQEMHSSEWKGGDRRMACRDACNVPNGRVRTAATLSQPPCSCSHLHPHLHTGQSCRSRGAPPSVDAASGSRCECGARRPRACTRTWLQSQHVWVSNSRGECGARSASRDTDSHTAGRRAYTEQPRRWLGGIGSSR